VLPSGIWGGLVLSPRSMESLRIFIQGESGTVNQKGWIVDKKGRGATILKNQRVTCGVQHKKESIYQEIRLGCDPRGSRM